MYIRLARSEDGWHAQPTGRYSRIELGCRVSLEVGLWRIWVQLEVCWLFSSSRVLHILCVPALYKCCRHRFIPLYNLSQVSPQYCRTSSLPMPSYIFFLRFNFHSLLSHSILVSIRLLDKSLPWYNIRIHSAQIWCVMKERARITDISLSHRNPSLTNTIAPILKKHQWELRAVNFLALQMIPQTGKPGKSPSFWQ